RFDGTQLRVQSLVRAPVNVNTAPRDVLVALFANLQLLDTKNDRVTPAEAGKLADEIIKRRNGPTPLRSLEEFRYLLRDLKDALSINDIEAIYRNAVNSHDQGLEFGTAPVTFRSFDVYMLRAGARVADKGGRLRAQLGSPTVVEIGSQLIVDKTWDTQVDLETALAATNSPRYWTSGPNNAGMFVANNVEPWPRWQKAIQNYIFPYDPYSRESGDAKSPYPTAAGGNETQEALNGDIRLAPARMEHDTAKRDSVFVEHFDYREYVDGLVVEAGYPLPRDGKLMKGVVQNDLVQGFSLQFWFQPRGSTGNAVLFDWGEAEYQNRIACFVDAAQNQLVFRVKDNTRIQWASDIRYDLSELKLLPENWYHIHLIATGCHPSMMALLVDGRSVGKAGLLTHLAGALPAQGGSISVSDASGFPDTGAVIVGNEVIEYQSVSDGQLVVRTDSQGEVVGRGMRGTLAAEHPDGATCALFGYSRPIVEDLRTGGATLTDNMGPWAVMQVDTGGDSDGTNQTDWANYDPKVDTGDPQTIGGGGAGGSTTTLVVHTQPLTGAFSGFTLEPYGNSPLEEDDKQTVEEQRRAFQNEGYALVVYLAGTQEDWDGFVNGGRQGCKGFAEFMRYTSDGSGGATGLTLERLENNGGAQSPPERDADYKMLVAYDKTVDGNAPVRYPVPVVIIPVSVSMTQASDEDYLNPVNEDEKDYWVAQLLSAGGEELDKWEWVRYSEKIDGNGK
ncbi:MAG: hypothetical protein L0206_21685, partial [Actinobacteria bacterium]|nr:hypothetical protein [Actinomycetota bacterium]